jgi:hypothetical protein
MTVALEKARAVQQQVQQQPRGPPLTRGRLVRSNASMGDPFALSRLSSSSSSSSMTNVTWNATTTTSSTRPSGSRSPVKRHLYNTKTQQHILSTDTMSSSANKQRWQVSTKRDSGIYPPPRPKYNLQKLAGLVGVPVPPPTVQI